MQPSLSPVLWLVGACIVVVVGVSSCDEEVEEPSVTVRRASYASKEECEVDWNGPEDCKQASVSGLGAFNGSNDDAPPSGSSGVSAGSTYTGASAHGSSFRWYGPYYTQSGTVYHPDGTRTLRDTWIWSSMRPLQAYDSAGRETLSRSVQGPPNAAMVEEATLRSSSLGNARTFAQSMRSAAVNHAPVTSRGGFGSRFGGGRSGGG